MKLLFVMATIAYMGHSQWGFDRWQRDLNQPFQSDYIYENSKTA